MKRFYPYKGVRRNRFRTDCPVFPKPFTADFPCVIGAESTRQGKKIVKWVGFGADIGASKDKSEAVKITNQKQLDALILYLGCYAGTQGVFVEDWKP